MKTLISLVLTLSEGIICGIYALLLAFILMMMLIVILAVLKVWAMGR